MGPLVVITGALVGAPDMVGPCVGGVKVGPLVDGFDVGVVVGRI